MRGMRENRLEVGSPAHVPDVRRDAVLRFLADETRHRACAHDRPPGRGLRRTGRTLALLLSRRRVRGILGSDSEDGSTLILFVVLAIAVTGSCCRALRAKGSSA